MGSITTTLSIQFLGTFLGLSAAASVLLKLREHKPAVKIVVALLCAVLLLIPIDGLFIFEYFISLVGHLSITTIVLLAAHLFEQPAKRRVIKASDKLVTYATIVAASVILYPTAYGLFRFDAYDLGFGSSAFIAALMLLAILITILRRNLTSLIIVVSVLAYSLHLLPSNNLWDYLIDPLVAIYAIVRTMILLFQKIIKPLRGSP